MDLLVDELAPARAQLDDAMRDLEAAIAGIRAQLAIVEAQHERGVRARHSLERLNRLVERLNGRLGRRVAGWADLAVSATEREQGPIRAAHDRFHELAAAIMREAV